MGLIGFIRILEHASKKDEIIMKDNYIEFNINILENFHKYYFEYFLFRYNIYKRESAKVDRYLLIARKEEKFLDATK
ncbi:hypothetical protein CF095_02090 [Clostridium botulinum]